MPHVAAGTMPSPATGLNTHILHFFVQAVHNAARPPDRTERRVLN